jgi:O-antigen/teichoic acid export membrane protein
MNKIIKNIYQSKIAKNGIYNLFSLTIPIILSLIVAPLMVHRMGTENYGLWIIATSILGAMGIFQLGLGTGVAKYVAEFSSKKDNLGLSSIITGTLGFYLIIGLSLTIPLYYLVPKIALVLKLSKDMSTDINESIRVVAFAFIPLLFTSVGLAVPMGLQNYKVSSILSVSKSILQQTTVMIIVLLGGSVYHVIVGATLVSWICATIFLFIALRMLVPYGLSFFLAGSMEENSSVFLYL